MFSRAPVHPHVTNPPPSQNLLVGMLSLHLAQAGAAGGWHPWVTPTGAEDMAGEQFPGLIPVPPQRLPPLKSTKEIVQIHSWNLASGQVLSHTSTGCCPLQAFAFLGCLLSCFCSRVPEPHGLTPALTPWLSLVPWASCLQVYLSVFSQAPTPQHFPWPLFPRGDFPLAYPPGSVIHSPSFTSSVSSSCAPTHSTMVRATCRQH